MRGLRFAKKKEAERATLRQEEAERPTLRREDEEAIEVGYKVQRGGSVRI